MAVDSSIPLSTNPQPVDVGKMLTLADLAQQMRQRQTQQQNQNALSGLLASPQSYDPNGSLNQDALRNVNALNPEFGMKYRQQQLDEHFEKLKEQSLTDDRLRGKLEIRGQIAATAEKAREDALKAGASPEKATDAAIKARNAALDGTGGLMSKEEIEGGKSMPYDPVVAGALKRFAPGAIQEDRLALQDKQNEARDKIAQQNADTAAKREKSFEQNIIGENRHRDAQDAATRQKIAAAAGDMSARGKELRASLAEMGVSFPSGMRSYKAQNDLLQSLAEKHPDLSPDDIAKLVRSGAINMKVEQTEGGVLGRREASILPVEKSITKPGGFLDQAEAAVNAIDFPKLKAAGSFEKWTKGQQSDPQLSAYKAAVAELRAEYSIVLSKGGQVTDAARSEAKEVIPDLITPGQFKSIKRTIQQGIESSKSGVEDSIEGVAGGKKSNANNVIHWDDLK